MSVYVSGRPVSGSYHGVSMNARSTIALNGDRIDLPITGMSCAACAARIEKRLTNQPGVTIASVNFATKMATVRFDPAAITPAAIAQAIDDLGFTATIPSNIQSQNSSVGTPAGDPIVEEAARLRSLRLK